MTTVEFYLRNGEKVLIDSKKVRCINSSREDGSRSTIEMSDGTVYKLANSFAYVTTELDFKLSTTNE